MTSAEQDSLARSIDLAERLRSAIGSERTLDAIASVPREWFVPGRERVRANDNSATNLPPVQRVPVGRGSASGRRHADAVAEDAS